MKRYLFSFAIVSLLSTTCAAQPGAFQHPALTYDPVARTYSFVVPEARELKRSAKRVEWASKTQIEPLVNVSVTGPKANELTYRYTLSNGIGSRQSITLFWLAPLDSITGVNKEPGLNLGELPSILEVNRVAGQVESKKAAGDYRKRYDSIADRYARETSASVRTDEVASWNAHLSYVELRGGTQLSFRDRRDPVEYPNRGLSGGQSMSFGFRSSSVPGLIWIPFEGSYDAPVLPSEEDRTEQQYEAWQQFQTQDIINVPTIAPRYPRPANMSSAQLLQTIRTEANAWKEKKMLSPEATEYVFGLLAKLGAESAQSARDAETTRAEIQNYLQAKQDGEPVVRQLIDLYITLLKTKPK